MVVNQLKVHTFQSFGFRYVNLHPYNQVVEFEYEDEFAEDSAEMIAILEEKAKQQRKNRIDALAAAIEDFQVGMMCNRELSCDWSTLCD